MFVSFLWLFVKKWFISHTLLHFLWSKYSITWIAISQTWKGSNDRLIIDGSISYYLFRRFVNLCALIISRIVSCRRAECIVPMHRIDISVRHSIVRCLCRSRWLASMGPNHFNFDCAVPTYMRRGIILHVVKVRIARANRSLVILNGIISLSGS